MNKFSLDNKLFGKPESERTESMNCSNSIGNSAECDKKVQAAGRIYPLDRRHLISY